MRKCLVLDLDNTLWKGVAGEEGGVEVTPAYYNFQQVILRLYERGVILAINSKNNQGDALPILQGGAGMALRGEHFAARQINWDDKATNMHRLAGELNIGLDSMVFMDDSAAERGWIRQALPEVLVVDMPDDPALYATALGDLMVFEQLGLTEEDLRRGEMYAAERKRRQLASSLSYEEYLESLQTVIMVERCAVEDLPRVGQLVRKVNQFNMTTRRYTDAELESKLVSPVSQIYTLRVQDCFGDSGLVGVAIISHHDFINTFLMSCRVIGRRIEHDFLHAILDDRGVSCMQAQFVPTAKNAPAASFYADFGFVSLGEGLWMWTQS